MTLADSDIALIKEKVNSLIDNVFVNEEFPYSSADHIINDQYVLKIFASLNQDSERKAEIRFVLKVRE